MKRSKNLLSAPVAIASIYFIFGFIWILLSDSILAGIFPDFEMYAHIQTFKGWIYVAVTTLLIFFLVRFYTRYQIKLTERILEREKEARRDLKEKEILLKEVHHRVKNNLQFIQSMIRLNLEHTSESTQVVEDINNRIYSIALIHEQIYASENLGNLLFDDYLNRLVEQIVSSVHLPAVSVLVESERIELDLDRVIPCGIIINEILTNSLKYAFPNGLAGTIRISFTEEQGKKKLSIEDTGVGIPSGVQENSFGFKLIDILSDQLNGKMLLDSNQNGTRFSIIFS